ncbi:hypothetical protein KSP39_PZI024444 [Platanthera zijinensis]|uniref:Uncharacterized protein n=1 Tax=Platanthera zijinensis TaxID=2320716 RepID=A0AAP0ASZ6_9ASPA
MRDGHDGAIKTEKLWRVREMLEKPRSSARMGPIGTIHLAGCALRGVRLAHSGCASPSVKLIHKERPCSARASGVAVLWPVCGLAVLDWKNSCYPEVIPCTTWHHDTYFLLLCYDLIVEKMWVVTRDACSAPLLVTRTQGVPRVARALGVPPPARALGVPPAARARGAPLLQARMRGAPRCIVHGILMYMHSTLTAEQIASLRRSYNIPAGLEIKILHGKPRKQIPRVGWMTLCESSLNSGLRFPPCDEVTEILKHFGVLTYQFTPLTMTHIMSLIAFFREHGSKFLLELFRE